MNGLGRQDKKEKDNQSIFTKETLGVVLVLFSTLALVCVITRGAIFSTPGQYVNAFFLGLFGYFAYAVLFFVLGIGVSLIVGKSLQLTKKVKLFVTLFFVFLTLIIHTATISTDAINYGEYLSLCYSRASDGIVTATGGGLIIGLVAYWISALLTSVGSYILLSLGLVTSVYFLVKELSDGQVKGSKNKNKAKFNSSHVKENDHLLDGINVQGEKEYPVLDAQLVADKPKQKLFVQNERDFSVKSRHELNKEKDAPGIKIGFSEGGLGVVNYGNDKNSPLSAEFKQKLEYIKTPIVIDTNKVEEVKKPISSLEPMNLEDFTSQRAPSVSEVIRNTNDIPNDTLGDFSVQDEIPFIEHEEELVAPPSAESRAEDFNKYLNVDESGFEQSNAVIEDIQVQEPTRDYQTEENLEENVDIDDIMDAFDLKNREEQEAQETQQREAQPRSTRVRDIFSNSEQAQEDNVDAQPRVERSRDASEFTSSRRSIFDSPIEEPIKQEPKQEEVKKEKEIPPINRKYYSPPLDLLESYARPIDESGENHQARMDIIKDTLESFHISAVPQSYIQGPTITRYEIMMPPGISVKKVLGLDDDLRMRLSARDGVRILAPIPGKNLVGVEVANNDKVTVGLRDVMEGLANQKVKPTSLTFALGKTIVGEAKSDDLAKGPHYLVAGSTGSGKSVCLHVMIVSLLMRYSPEELKLVLVDPKGVEFRKYEHMPHLLVDEIITEPKRAIALLQWAYEETTRRNNLFTSCGGEISDISDYNTHIASDTVPKLPRIVFVIDELADLMEGNKKDLEAKIRAVAAKSRSAGIHLVLATQRPSVDVVTGTIKANLPSRIALKVTNYNDSQTILGEGGAEKLLGYGDMLYRNSAMADYERYQGAYISGREVTNVVKYIIEHNKAYFDDDAFEYMENETRPPQETAVTTDGANAQKPLDDLFYKALWMAVNSGSISVSQIQRRYSVGWNRAGSVVDKMEMMGYIAPNEGNGKARQVYLTKEEYLEKYGPVNEDDLY